MAIPVNWTTSVRFESKDLINSGNMGANAKGPMLSTNVAAVAHVNVENFQNVLQFCISINESAYAVSFLTKALLPDNSFSEFCAVRLTSGS